MALEPGDLDQIRELIEAGANHVVETLRAEIRTGDGETREVLRGEIRAGDAETREVLRGEIRAGDEGLRAAMRAGDAETRRHAGVLVESLTSRIQLVAESVHGLDQKVDRIHGELRTVLQNHDRRLVRLEARSLRPPRS